MRDSLNTALGDRYEVEREIGRGGMASVWRARDIRHGRIVAIKVLHPEFAGAIAVDRFVREIRLTAGLQHPNIIPVLDSGSFAGPTGVTLPWYAMTYIDGESLRSRLDRERHLPIEEALGIAEAAADALQTAHRHGIVHRDIKPENLLLADGRVYVADFGVARILLETGAERLTSTGLAIGTPVYMSPEQGMADAVDAASDQYSLACVTYEMLAGEPPFTGRSTQSIIARRLTEPARPIRTLRPSVPANVESAVLRGLERVPADRFPDVTSFARALRLPGSGSSDRPWSGRSWGIAAAGLIVLALGVVSWARFGKARAPDRPTTDATVLTLYQRGVRGYDKRSAQGTTDAIAAFAAALSRDSTYLPAWNGLAKVYVRAYERPFPIPGVPRDSMLRLALSAVDRALSLDNRSEDAWLTQAMLGRDIDPTDNAPVFRSLDRALALDSTDARAWHFFALARAENGDLSGALSAWRRSVRMDPSYTQGLAFLSIGHYWCHQYDSARVWSDSSLAVDPNYVLGRNNSGLIAVERGDYDRAIAEFEAARRLTSDVESINALAGLALADARAGRKSEALVRLKEAESEAGAYSPPTLHPVVFIAEAYAQAGEPDHALSWLARYRPRESVHFQAHLRYDPPFEPLRADPRFKALLKTPAFPPGKSC